jgi:hypothetical protein
LKTSLCLLQSYVSTNLNVNSNSVAEVDLSDDDPPAAGSRRCDSPAVGLPAADAAEGRKRFKLEDCGTAAATGTNLVVGAVKLEQPGREEDDPLVVPKLEVEPVAQPQSTAAKPKARKPLPALLKIGSSGQRDNEVSHLAG